MQVKNEDNWLVLTMEYLRELHNDLENLDEHERADELQDLIDYLDKTN